MVFILELAAQMSVFGRLNVLQASTTIPPWRRLVVCMWSLLHCDPCTPGEFDLIDLVYAHRWFHILLLFLGVVDLIADALPCAPAHSHWSRPWLHPNTKTQATKYAVTIVRMALCSTILLRWSASRHRSDFPRSVVGKHVLPEAD